MAAGDGEPVLQSKSVCVVGGGMAGLAAAHELRREGHAITAWSRHYAQPMPPSGMQGMGEWRRRQLHSHSYRTPEPFRGEAVVVIGCGDSGKDIALDLCHVAWEVHLAASSEVATPAMLRMLANHDDVLRLHPRIQLHVDGRVEFADGSSVVADTVIYCTGYAYSFPFLDTGGAVTVGDNGYVVGPLFEHVFPPSLAPTLSFVGVPRKIPISWFLEVQARWVAQVLSGCRELPSEEGMLRSVEEHLRAREAAGVPTKRTHNIASVEPRDMYEFGEKYCDFTPTEEWNKELILSSNSSMDDDVETFRDRADDDSDGRDDCDFTRPSPTFLKKKNFSQKKKKPQ